MQISKLLELFEISAKTLAEKEIQIDKGKSGIKGEEKMVEKLDMLLDQNKIIARGLTLLHEPSQQIVPQPMPQQMPQRIPSMAPQRQPMPQREQTTPGGYQKSMPMQKPAPKKLSNFKRRKPEEKEDESVF